MSWETSDRHDRLPSNWPQIVAQVRHRANGQCQADVHVPDCDHIGTDCDHIEQGDNHSLSNLQWLSRPCHERKTRLDNGLVRHLALPAEKHPGSLR